MSYRALIPVVAGLTVLVAVAVSTLVEVERDARRRARQGRGGQSVAPAAATLPPRPSVPPAGVTGREGRSVTALPAPSRPLAWASAPDDEVARSARRMLDLHREG